ncbi:hypothetical protein ACK8P5_26495 (plasmid) [Paenibacillus sp. EC2-1]|uniref:hypothetical protein n=1 Tax=Paenibacillus sp. EC2-1 TaxID=3388665 RepID=UPI003BEEC4DB
MTQDNEVLCKSDFEVQSPLLQRRYVQKLKINLQMTLSMARMTSMAEDDLETIRQSINMCDAIIKDDLVQMYELLPTKYYEIIGPAGLRVGKTTDPDDVWDEEKHYRCREISKEEFDAED